MNRWNKRIIALFLTMILVNCSIPFIANGNAEAMTFMHTLPVVMLTVDENDLWDETTGLLAEGASIDKSQLPFKNAVYRETGCQARAGHIQIIMPDGTVMIDQAMTIQLYSLYNGVELDMPQKPFEIHALQGEAFYGKLFDQTERESFTGLVLSNNGCDAVDTNLRDVYISALLDAYNPAILHQAYRPAAVYLNGTYWGMYALGESMDADWAAYYTGVDAEKATMLRLSGSLVYGQSSEQQDYRDVISYIKSNPVSSSTENLEYLMQHIDADAYLEYMAMIIFLGDSDPATICVINSGDGKWRLISQNNDYCLYNSKYNSVASYTKSAGMGMQNIDNTVLLGLLKIEEYRDLFLTKLGKAYQFFSADNMIRILDPIVQSVQGEMMLHYVRWCHEEIKALSYGSYKDDAYAGYQLWLTRVERLRNVCRRRPAYMWSYIQKGFKLSDDEMLAYFGAAPASWEDIVADK